MDTYVVYKHTLKEDGRVYIGQTHDVETRWSGNGTQYKGCVYFWRTIAKYGWDAFAHEIILKGLSKEEADVYEDMFIKQYDSMNPEKGFNLKGGGSHGKLSEATRKKISVANKGKTIPEETRQKMSVAQTGRKHSAATKKKIGEGNKGKIVSEEAKRRMSIAQTGHITSEEQKQKLVLSSPRRKTIRCIETGEIFNSYRDAERKTGIKHQTISDCINGKQKTTGGYHWEVVRGDE